MPSTNGGGNIPDTWTKFTLVPVGIFALYGKLNVLLELRATKLWVTLAFTVGADVNPLPGLLTITDCITSLRISGSNSNKEPWPPSRSISGCDTKLAPPFITSK